MATPVQGPISERDPEFDAFDPGFRHPDLTPQPESRRFATAWNRIVGSGSNRASGGRRRLGTGPIPAIDPASFPGRGLRGYGEMPDLSETRAALIQLSPSLFYEPDNLNEASLRLFKAMELNPEIKAVFDSNNYDAIARAAAMSTPEWMAARALGKLDPEDSWVNGLLKGAADEWLDRRSTIVYGQQLFDGEARASGAWNDFSADAEPIRFDDLKDSLYEAFGDRPVGSGLPSVPSMFGEARNILGRGGGWAWDEGRMLAIQVPTATNDDQIAYFLIELDEGTQINGTLDALTAYLMAEDGIAHRKLATSDDLPGRRTPIGLAFGTAGWLVSKSMSALGDSDVEMLNNVVGNFADNVEIIRSAAEGRPYRDEEERREQRKRQMVEMETEGVNEEDMLAFLSAGFFTGGGISEVRRAMQKYAAEGEITPQQAAEMREEDLYEVISRALEERGPVAELVQNSTELAMEGVMLFDAAVHWAGIRGIQALGLTDVFADEDMQTGAEYLLDATYGTIPEVDSTWISEELGIEGRNAFWADLGWSLFAGPDMWFAAGGRASARQMLKELSDPAYISRHLSHPRYQAAFDELGQGHIGALWQVTDGFLGSPRFHLELLEATQTQAGREVVQEIFERGMREDLVLAPGFDRVTSRQYAGGLAGAFANRRIWRPTRTGGLRGPARRLIDWVNKAPSSPTIELSDAVFLKQALDLIPVLFWDDLPLANEWTERIIRTAADADNGFPLRRAQLIREMENLRREIRVIAQRSSRTRRAAGGDETALSRNLSQLDDLEARINLRLQENLAEGVEAAPGRVGEEALARIRNLRAPVQQRYDNMMSDLSESVPAMRQLQAEIRRKTAELAQLNNPRLNAPLVTMMDELWQVVGEAAGVPRRLRAGQPIQVGIRQVGDETVPVYQLDWAQVTGRSGTRRIEAADRVLDYEAFAGDATDEALKGLQALNVFARSNQLLMPASPRQIVAWRNASPRVRAIMAKRQKRNAFRRAIDATTNFWVWQVLSNPVTGAKVSGDEVFRFAQETGSLRSIQAAGVGIPGVGRVLRGSPGTRAAAFGGRVADPLNIQRPYQMVKSARAAEKWVNQALVLNEGFQAFARGERAWREWFEETGRHTLRSTTINLETGVPTMPVNATTGWRWMNEAWDTWVGVGKRSEVAEEILDAARRGEQIPWTRTGGRGGPRFFRRVGEVPGEPVTQRFGVMRSIMDTMFTQPQRRRAEVFYQYYEDYARRIFMARHGGRVLTPQRLMDEYGVTEQVAHNMISAGRRNPRVQHLVRNRGMFLEDDIARASAAWASPNAERLMYKMGALSMGGDVARDFFPFVRAHLEFLDWYFRKLFQPLELRIPFTGGRFGSVTARVPGVPVLQEGIPLNLRMWQRWSGILRQGDRTDDDDEEGVTPSDFFSRLTFFPDRASEVTGALLPAFGYLPDFLIEQAVDSGVIPESFVEEWESLMPGLAYLDLNSDFLDRAIDTVSPFGGPSARRQVAGLLKMFGVHKGNVPSWAQFLAGMESLPVGYTSTRADLLGDWMEENWDLTPPENVLAASTTEEGTSWYDKIVQVDEDAMDKATRAEGGAITERYYNPFASHPASDFGELRHYQGLMETLTTLEGLGVVFPTQADEMRELWTEFQDGGLTAAESRRFFRVANDVLWQNMSAPWFTDASGADSISTFRDLIIANNPGIAVNMVSRQRCVGKIPERFAGACKGGRLVITTDYETRTAMIEAGVIEPVPFAEWAFNVQQRVAGAQRKVLEDELNLLFNTFFEAEETRVIDGEKVKGKVSIPFMEANRRGRKDVREGRVLIDPNGRWRRVADRARISIPQEFINEDGQYEMTGEQMWSLFAGPPGVRGGGWRGKWGMPPVFPDQLANKLAHVGNYTSATGHTENAYRKYLSVDLMRDFALTSQEMEDAGFKSVEDWPDDIREEYRQRFSEAIIEFAGERNGITEADYYEAGLHRTLGPPDWRPELPTGPEDVDVEFRIRGHPDEFGIVDGDTIKITMGHGEARFRIVGLNAPEQSQDGYPYAIAEMDKLLSYASDNDLEITLGIYKPEIYGWRNSHFVDGTLEHRVNVWLFVGDSLIADTSVFTATNPRGVAVGGDVLDLVAIAKGETP